jgi:hypothetical protein
LQNGHARAALATPSIAIAAKRQTRFIRSRTPERGPAPQPGIV